MKKRTQTERRFAKLFKGPDPLGAYHQAVRALDQRGEPVDRCLERAAHWFLRYCRVPWPDILPSLLSGISHPSQPDPEAFYLVCSLLRRRPRLGSISSLALVTGAAGILAADPNVDYSLGLFFLDHAERAMDAQSPSDSRDWAVADLRSRAAAILMNRSDSNARLAGQESMRQQIQTLQNLCARNIPLAEDSLGRAMHNLGLALLDETERSGDPEAARQGVSMLRDALALPARRTDPSSFELALRQLAIGLRQLAAIEEDLDDAIELLDEAERHLLEAIETVRSRPGWQGDTRFASKQTLINVRLQVADLLLRTGRITQEEATRRQKEAASWGIRVLEAIEPAELGIESSNALRKYRRISNRPDDSTGEAPEDLLRLLSSLRMRSDAFLNETEAGSLASVIADLDVDAVSSQELDVLAELIGAVSPRNINLGMARILMRTESSVVYHSSLGSRTLVDGSRYLDRRLRDLLARIDDPLASGIEKRLLSSWIRALAMAELLKAGTDIAPQTLLFLLDLTGAAAFRADSAFFGQGAMVTDAEVVPKDEATARAALYIDRNQLDDLGFLIACEDISEHIRRGDADLGPAEADIVLESFERVRREAAIYDLGSGAPEKTSNPHPRQEVLRRRRQMADLLREFPELISHGSGPPEAKPLPDGEIAAALARHPGLGVLVATSLRPWTIATFKDGRLRLLDVGPEPDSPEDEALHGSLTNFGEALARTLGHTPDPSGVGGLSAQLGGAEHALNDLRAVFSPVARRIVDVATESGLDELVLLDREIGAGIPWEALETSSDAGSPVLLGEVVPLTRTYTLFPIGTKATEDAGAILSYVGCRPGIRSGLQLGRSVLGPEVSFHSGVEGRHAFEEKAKCAAVLRLFVHGEFVGFPSAANGLVLDEENPRPLWTGPEIRALDLTRCRRVELWACEAAFELDVEGGFLHHEEPSGIAASFLLAGARMVIGSRWKVPAVTAALIADAFQWLVTDEVSTRAAADALSKAVGIYRSVVTAGGPFEQALRAGQTDGEIFHVARTVLARAMDREPPQKQTRQDKASHLVRAHLGPLGQRELSEMKSRDLERAADHLLQSLRGPMAWGGWRVIVAGFPRRS